MGYNESYFQELPEADVNMSSFYAEHLLLCVNSLLENPEFHDKILQETHDIFRQIITLEKQYRESVQKIESKEFKTLVGIERKCNVDPIKSYYLLLDDSCRALFRTKRTKKKAFNIQSLK